MKIFDRLEILIGKEKLVKLQKSKVAVFGLGGVGSYAAEAIVRSGIGNVAIIDGDVVEESNFNRQLFATKTALNKFKVDVAKDRFLEINPEVKIKTYNFFYQTETVDFIDIAKYDYIIDAIDDIDAKVMLAKAAFDQKVNLISAMSAGNKFNSTMFEVADIFETTVCPIAKIMRKKLKDIGIPHLKVVYSKEKPVHTNEAIIGSTAFVPPVCGFILAGEVIRYLIGTD